MHMINLASELLVLSTCKPQILQFNNLAAIGRPYESEPMVRVQKHHLRWQLKANIRFELQLVLKLV